MPVKTYITVDRAIFFRSFGNEIFVEIPAAQKPVDGTVVVPAQTLVRSSWYRL